MAGITRIEVRIITGSWATDGDVYIRIGGREFYVDSRADDFEAHSDRTYVFGVYGADPDYSSQNDPGSPHLLTEHLDRFPVNLRFVPLSPRLGPNDIWHVRSITVTVNPGPEQVQYQSLGAIKLGRFAGLYCDLIKV